MSDAVINGIIVAASGIVILVLGKIFGRKDISYSQIQKDLAGQRNHTLNIENELQWVRDILTITIDESEELRQVMRDASLPVPARHPRPPRPTLIKMDIPE